MRRPKNGSREEFLLACRVHLRMEYLQAEGFSEGEALNIITEELDSEYP